MKVTTNSYISILPIDASYGPVELVITSSSVPSAEPACLVAESALHRFLFRVARPLTDRLAETLVNLEQPWGAPQPSAAGNSRWSR